MPTRGAGRAPGGGLRPSSILQSKYRRLARHYDRLDARFEKNWKSGLRPLLFEGLAGTVLDIGAGTGLSIPYYPADAEITAVDLSPEMLEIARERAAELGRNVDFHTMDATSLALPAASFDHAVGAFLFCNLPGELQRPALTELARVVRPGGSIRLLDYRLAERWFDRLVMRVREPLLKLMYGARFEPETERHVHAAGLVIREHRVVAGGRARLLVLAHA